MISAALRFTGVAAIACLGLAGCSGEDEVDADTAMVADDAAVMTDAADMEALTISDGIGACFEAIEDQLGSDIKIAEVNTNVSPGADIDSGASEPAGTVTSCSVQYQDPDNPKKLLERNMAGTPGRFGEPNPVEITVMGDAASFNLEDMLVPLSEVNYEALNTTAASMKTKLDNRFSAHGWKQVRLNAPDAFNDVHVFRITTAGRLKSNDIQDDGYATVALDGKTIVKNELTS